jgi:hypothetical protein
MAPRWTPDSGPVAGPAAHQRLSTPAIHARLSILQVHRAEQAGLPTEAVERAERLAALDRQIDACLLALRWRGDERS